MKQLVLLALALAAVPAQGNERPPDPIAWKCYMCTPEEREKVALSKGEGEHYVYNAAGWETIYGYRVTGPEGQRSVQAFTPEYWIRTQYRKYMSSENSAGTAFVDTYGVVSLYPPGSPHVRTDLLLWGHHVSALHPRTEEARELVRRSVVGRTRSYLEADTEHGRILRLEPQLEGHLPLLVRLNLNLYLGHIYYHFDYDTRRWEYLESYDDYQRIQERAEDFLAADGAPRVFRYPTTTANRDFGWGFVSRAQWAGVSILGSVPPTGPVEFHCGRNGAAIQCRVY